MTPLDREDTNKLAVSLDDVVDAIDASAAAVRLYRVTEVRAEALELARIITASADQVAPRTRLPGRLSEWVRHGDSLPCVGEWLVGSFGRGS